MELPTAPALPPSLELEIIKRLPADARARAACVCPRWRDALKDPSLWLRLDLSVTSGVTCSVNYEALKAAAARAGGALQALDLTGRTCLLHPVREVVAANAASLRELRTLCSSLLTVPADELVEPPSFGDESYMTILRQMMTALPALQVVEADAWGGCAAARRVLRNEPPFGPLRLRKLSIYLDANTDIPALTPDLVAHPSLTKLELVSDLSRDARLPGAALSSLLDTASTLRLSGLFCFGCCPTQADAPALASLISRSTFTSLEFAAQGDDAPRMDAMLDGPAAALLANAVRASRTLQELTLHNVRLWDDVEAALVLLDALTGHVSLRKLDCSFNSVDPTAAAIIDAALGALVEANAPAFEELHVTGCGLRVTNLGPMVDALLRNTHLHTLAMEGNGMSDDFAAQRLLPAVRANSSLRRLVIERPIGLGIRKRKAGDQAVDLVRSRGGQHD